MNSASSSSFRYRKNGDIDDSEVFKKNRDALVDKGFYFMKATGEVDDKKLSVYCLLENQFDAFHKNNSIDTKDKKRAFEKEVEESIEKEISTLPGYVHTIIFSSEHLHSIISSYDQRLKLKNLLSRHFESVDLLSYIRPQVEMAVSHYSTYLKTQGYGSLEEYLKKCNPNNCYYDYWKYLSGWELGFSSSNLNVRIFNKKRIN